MPWVTRRTNASRMASALLCGVVLATGISTFAMTASSAAAGLLHRGKVAHVPVQIASGTASGPYGDTLSASIYAWSNGMTVVWTGYVGYSFASEFAGYSNMNTSASSQQAVTCEGPDFSIFIPLPPGNYILGANGIPGDVNIGGVATIGGGDPAPPTSCISPPSLYLGENTSPIAALVGTPSGHGYWIADTDGSLRAHGDAEFYNDARDEGIRLNAPIVGMAATLDGGGYWLLGKDGGVFSFGDAQFYGSTGNLRLNQPVVGMAATPDGHGYWFVAADGGVFSFGDAQFYGSTGNLRLNQPVVGMAPTPDGKGYYLDASDGGIFCFGNAQFQGSMGAVRLNKPAVGMAVDPSTGGYWLVASDGGIFTFNTPFYGSAGNVNLSYPVVGMATPPDGSGYWLVTSGGGVYPYNITSYGQV